MCCFPVTIWSPVSQSRYYGCGCHGKCAKAPMLNENLGAKVIMTENMQYHIDNKKSLTENTFRYGSKAFLDLWAEARYLYSRDAINLSGEDKIIVETTHLGEYGLFEGEMVPLDLVIMEEETMEENISGADKDKIVALISKITLFILLYWENGTVTTCSNSSAYAISVLFCVFITSHFITVLNNQL